jgi:hypothetical protein
MKKSASLIMICLLNSSLLFSQVAINTDGTAADNSAMLDVKSTNKGFLPPRMTQEQIGEISSPADGLMVYCTTDGKLYIYSAAIYQWKEITFGTGIITPPFSCGMTFIINHVAGNVAPVSKTVTYGTVTNIPGETSKCWITRNLGADHQADSVDDPTEASAGWYWQFNRLQGYKHSGSTVTPAWTISWIDENSDWLSANDPCASLLGNGWRLPTSTEWTNVDTWLTWDDTWNSPLKLHAAGNLGYFDGSLGARGYCGYYWSSSQGSDLYGWHIYLYHASCNVDFTPKANGFSSRCLLD